MRPAPGPRAGGTLRCAVTPRLPRRTLVLAATAAACLLSAAPAAAQGTEPPLTASPRADCGPGAVPEPGIQGRVPAGANPAGYKCNLNLIGRQGVGGGFKVERFVDKAGRECAYYDTTLLFPTNIATLSRQTTGVAVLDMSDPAKPVQTSTLLTPAMESPHESLELNQKRGLLAAVLGNPLVYPGVVDIYDLNEDCRFPVLQSSSPVGVLGHESGFSEDGNTFYATSISTGHVTAVDVSNPKVPVPLAIGEYPSHGLRLSADGNRAYIAGGDGLVIVDTSDIQARRPDPKFRTISTLTWPSMTIPQVAIPVTIKGKPYLVEVDEFSTNDQGDLEGHGPRVGAGRIIDISDERAPKIVSNFRLAVNNRENRAAIAGDPGASSFVQGYAGHYCEVPQAKDPGIVACSFIVSGMRVFDIRDPLKPKELAYFVAPPAPSPRGEGGEVSNYAMSAPSFVPQRREIWYSDGNSGFYALRMAAGVWPFAGSSQSSAGRLGLTVTPRRVRAGRRVRFSFRVTQRGASASSVRVAARRATVRFAGRTLRTDSRGRASVVLRLGRAGSRRVTATKRGFRSARSSVRAVQVTPRNVG